MKEQNNGHSEDVNGRLMEAAVALNRLHTAKVQMREADVEDVIRCVELIADLSDSELQTLVDHQKKPKLDG